MPRFFFFPVLVLALCSCASAAPHPSAAPAAEARPSSHIQMSTVPGWTRIRSASAAPDSVAYVHRGTGAAIGASLVEDERSPAKVVHDAMASFLSVGDAVCTVDPLGSDTYAAADCEGVRNGHVVHERFAVRRPHDRPDLLLVMTCTRPEGVPSGFDEQVAMMFLLASAH